MRPAAKTGWVRDSMAVNVMRWLGQRIDMVEAITSVPALEAAE